MDRGYSSGFSRWGGAGGGGGSSRGSGSYDLYGYKDSMSSGGGFGSSNYGGNDRMKRDMSGDSMLSSSNADVVIAKINQRLDMLTQLEGGAKGSMRGERCDQYESFDSRSASFGSRDLFRSGNFGYGDSRGDLMTQRGGVGFGGFAMGGGGGGGGFDNTASAFGSGKMRQSRDTFSGSGWGEGRRSPHRGGMSAGGRGFGRKHDPTSAGGGGGWGGVQGYSPAGRGKPPSLLPHRMFSGGAFQPQHGPQDFSVRNFGGAPRGNRQRGRKKPNSNRPMKMQRDGQKKRKQSQGGADEPESKTVRVEGDNPDGEEQSEDPEPEEQADGTASVSGVVKSSGPSSQDDSPNKSKAFPATTSSKTRKRRGFFERFTYACSVCKFRSFYSEDMKIHLDSKFHKDHFKYLTNHLSKPITDFLQDYLNNKFKKTEQRVVQDENHSSTICQVFKEQDLTREFGMEHFMKRVEAAHCSACNVFIPMQHMLIQKHLKSPDHNHNRKAMMEQSKKSSLSVARSILNHKVIGKKLECYLKGENPFDDNQDDQVQEEAVMETDEGLAEEGKGPLAESEVLGNGEKHEEKSVAEAEEGVPVWEEDDCLAHGEEGVPVEDVDDGEQGLELGVPMGDEEGIPMADEDAALLGDEEDSELGLETVARESADGAQ